MDKEAYMLQIGKALVSLDVVEKKFVCDLAVCKGTCCVEGDSGAPLDENEKELIEEAYPGFKEYMTEEGIKAVEEQGLHVIDFEDDLVTPLIDKKECAFLITENGNYWCAIEKAFLAGKVKYRKPLSCQLYPIRITKYPEFDAVNYDKWDICKCAREKGFGEGTPVYKFLKEPLIRKYGEAWYNELEEVAENIGDLYNETK
jgi:hypothetical protein